MALSRVQRLGLGALAAVLVLIGFAAPGPAAGSSFRNPVAPEAADGADTPDPWIFRHGGEYWLTYTSPGQIVVRTAPTLAGLASAKPQRLWPRPGTSEPDERCCEIWAPEIHRLVGPDGPRWYIYYAAKGSTEEFAHRIYVLESRGRSPAGPYRFEGQIAVPQPFAIDATVASVRGRHYLIYSGGSSFTPTSLYLAPLDSPSTLAAEPIEISTPTLAWEQVAFAINEGPEVLQHGRLLHVIYSASWCGTGAYSLGRLTVPRRADLLDPRTWADAKHPRAAFAAAPDRGVYGPGHGSFFTSPDGRQSWMVYHAAEQDRGCFTGGLRTTRAQRFRWHGDVPRFGRPVGLGTDIAAPGGDGTIAAQAEDALAWAPSRRAELVSDRRLVGYEGLDVRPANGRLPGLRVRIPSGGRFSLHLRLLAGPGVGPIRLMRGGRVAATRSAQRAGEGPAELGFGTLRLRRGANVIRFRSSAAVTLDQLRLEPGR